MKKIILTTLALFATACGGKAYADCIYSNGTICTDVRLKSIQMSAVDIYNSGNAFIGMNTIDRINQNNPYGCGSQNLVGLNSKVFNNERNRSNCSNLVYNDLWHFGATNGIYAQTKPISYKPMSAIGRIIANVNVTFDSSEWYSFRNSHPNNGSFFILEITNSNGKIIAENSYGGHSLKFGSPTILSIVAENVLASDMNGLQARVKINYPGGIATYPFPVIHIHSIFLQAQEIGESNNASSAFSNSYITYKKPVLKISGEEFKKKLAELARNDNSPDQYYKRFYQQKYGELP